MTIFVSGSRGETGISLFLLLMEEIRRAPVEVGSLPGVLYPRWLAGFLSSTV